MKRKSLTNVVAAYFNLNNPALPHYVLCARTDSGLNIGENRERNQRRENSDPGHQGRWHRPDGVRDPALSAGSCRAGKGGRRREGSDWLQYAGLPAGARPVSAAEQLGFVGWPAR